MNDSSPEFFVGALLGVLAGIVCGLCPIAFAKSRKRLDLAWVSLAVCLVSGLFLGLLLAVPAAIACTVVILALERGGEPTDLELWQATVTAPVQLTSPQPEATTAATPAPPAPQGVPAPLALGAFARNRLGQGELPIHCPSCGNTFAAAATNLPPWCARCGADLKHRQPRAPVAPAPTEPDESFRAAAPQPDRDAFQPAPSDAFRSAPTGEAEG